MPKPSKVRLKPLRVVLFMFVCLRWKWSRIKSVGLRKPAFLFQTLLLKELRVSLGVKKAKRAISTTEEELKKFREDRLLKRLVENLDNELKRYQAQPFLQAAFESVRRLGRDLVGLLRRGGSYTEERF